MKNITVSIDEEIHRRARIRAAELGTSLSSLVRDYLVKLGGAETDFERRKRLEREIIGSIQHFDGGDRLARDEVHARHALH